MSNQSDLGILFLPFKDAGKAVQSHVLGNSHTGLLLVKDKRKIACPCFLHPSSLCGAHKSGCVYCSEDFPCLMCKSHLSC